jgi:hypothetical protein
LITLYRNNQLLITIAGSVIAAFFVYSVLSYFFIGTRIAIPISIIMGVLIFGLTRYYNGILSDGKEKQDPKSILSSNQRKDGQHSKSTKENGESDLLFVAIFVILILITSFPYKQDFHIFINWNEIGIYGLIQLCAAIALSFFIPGYGIVRILCKNHATDRVLVILLSYLLSMLITGLVAYIYALFFDGDISESQYLFSAVYLGILASFLGYRSRYRIIYSNSLGIKDYFCYHFNIGLIIGYLKSRNPELLVFGSLFALIIMSTYALYGGTTIGDQWYHQGRALLFMYGSIKEAVLSYGETSYYPPFQSALLAAFTTLSGVPLVNAYASIAFLNVIPIFAFYYFFSAWVPNSLKKAKLLACSLFTLASGFGWIYLLSKSTTYPIVSPHSTLETLTSLRNLDIINASNFVISTAPDFSTGLIYIALPAGLVLLGLTRACVDFRFRNIFIVTSVSVLGIISHYEFYLFIIIASILPIVFNMNSKNFLYFSILIAILVVYLMDVIIPGNFFTSITILGFPLLLLTILLVIITWTLYFARRYLSKIVEGISTFLKPLKYLIYNNKASKIVTTRVIIFLVAYLYLLSFVILGQLSPNAIMSHTSAESTVPWYLYPMRLGVAGLLGAVFILSCLFKRFEKEVLVFGVIIVISLIVGPYYSESRFTKYIMIGIICFASIIIYKMLNRSNNHVINIALISIIVPCSGFSILIFTGYNSLIVQAQDYIDTLPRRHFPSMAELHLFETLHNLVNMSSNKYNVVGFSNEYDRYKDGFMAKVASFIGLPYDKVRQSPLTLNASTLDELYRHLAYSNARFIIIPKHSIQSEISVTEPTKFAIDHFRRAYEDSNYVVLEVPPIEPPRASSKIDVAMVFSQGEDLTSAGVSDVRLLPFNNDTFNFRAHDQSTVSEKNNQTQHVILLSSKTDNGTTLWSKPIDREAKVNSIETRFRILPEVDGNNDTSNTGLKWKEGDKEYYTKLSNDGLELSQKTIGKKYSKLLSKSTEVAKKDLIWYTLRIESLHDSLKVYMNDVLMFRTLKNISSDAYPGISNIGLASYHDKVEFAPIKILNSSRPSFESYYKSKYFNYYYPLNILALSKAKYDVFKENDLSVLSNKIIIVPDILKLDDSVYNSYREFCSNGGILVVINPNSNFSGTFSRLFSVHADESSTESFSKLSGNMNQNVSITVPGLVKRLELKTSPELRVIASYQNDNNQTVAPFAIEKTCSKGGRIVLINAEGYFNTIINSPMKYFDSLSNISRLIGLNSTGVTTYNNTAIPMKGFIGNMEVSGNVILNTGSLFLLDNYSYPYSINAKHITIFNKSSNSMITFDNVSIKSLKLVGHSETKINATGKLKLPEMNSRGDYISTMMPNDFNMTVVLYPESHINMSIVAQNHSFIKNLQVNNDSKIDFYDLRAEAPLNYIPVLLKNPELTVNGNTSIKNAILNGYLETTGALNRGSPLNFEGKLKSKFDFSDNYYEPHSGITITKYISFLKSMTMDGKKNQHLEYLKIPGDIPVNAKGQDFQFTNILYSSNGILAIIVAGLVTMVGTWLIQRIYV